MADRATVGIWSELPPGARWANEGISRIVGFLIEGGAATGNYLYKVAVRRGMAETVRSDLRTLQAVEGKDWVVIEPSPQFERSWSRSIEAKNLSESEYSIALLAAFANSEICVDGWIITFPHFEGSLKLKARKAVLLPDAIPFDFPIGWDYAHYWGPQGEWIRWRETATRVLQAGDAVIAHSKHVAERHGVKLLGIEPERITVVPHAPPDLAPILELSQARIKSSDSIYAAASILRQYAAECGLEYLYRFPFEEVPYVVVATQDRVTKNIGRAAEAVRRIVRRDRISLKLITTAPLHMGAEWSLLPNLVERELLNRDLVSLPDVPRSVHAALFHCASLTVHPSFYEGIVGTLPFYESLSVGTPCIVADGPHVRELLETQPELEPYVFDGYDVEAISRLIVGTLEDPAAAFADELPAYENRRKRGWDKVAAAYADAAIGLESRTLAD